MEVPADDAAERGDALRQLANLLRRPDADRVREDDLVRAAEPLRERDDDARVDAPSNGHPNATLIVTVAGRSAASRILLDARGRLLDGRVRVPLRERVGRGERDVHAVERRRAQPLVALLVQHEAGERRSVAPLDPADDLLGAGHLRHAVVPDEAHRLDAREPGGGEHVHELGPHARREHVRLVLEPVARPDVADDHDVENGGRRTSSVHDM